MKHKIRNIRRALWCIVFCLGFAKIDAQQILKGKVLTVNGRGIPNVQVMVKGTDNSTFTTNDGTYSIDAPVSAILVFSSNGYINVESVITDTLLNQTMQPKEQVVLFGKQNNQNVIQSIASVSGDQLVHRPTFHMGTNLFGVLPGLGVSLNSGLPSAQMNFSLRGGMPLIIVDGIPRSAVNLSPEQIESVSVIKDALGLSMLGMMAGNGVVSIVTKKGIDQSLKVNFTSQISRSKQLYKPPFVEAYTYALLFNEALANDNYSRVYSQADLAAYKTGSDPYNKPNVDWYNQLLETSAPIQQYNVNFIGGGRTARYFLDIDYHNQDGFLKQDKSINVYPTKDQYKKYSTRIKTDINLTPETFFEVNIFGQMMKENTPGVGVSAIYNDLANTPNNAYPKLNPDGTLGGNRIYLNNLYGQSVFSGYNTYNTTDLNIDLRITQQLDKVLKGLKVGGVFSYNSMYRESLNRSKPRAVYEYSSNSDGSNASYTQLSSIAPQSNSSSYNRQNRMINIELSADYDVEIKEHVVKNKLLYINNNYLIQNNLPFINSGVMGRSQYNFSNRYFAEFAWSYMGLNQLKSKHQYGFFPAVGLGWDMAQESWFANLFQINLLKIKATYGKVGNNLAANYFDVSSGTPQYYYDYQKRYVGGNSVYFGNVAGSSTLIEADLPYISSWEKIKKFNFGIELLALQSISLSAEYFNNYYTDILQQRGTNNSGIIGIGTALENIGKNRISGFEFVFGLDKKSNSFEWIISANIGTTKTKRIFLDEPTRAHQYMSRTNSPINQFFGHQSDGFFQSQNEIDDYLQNNKIEGYTPIPGDLKYRDLNNDRLIDDRDVSAIGRTKPIINYGFFGNVVWKGFGLSMQWFGMANRDVYLNDMPFVESNGRYWGLVTSDHLDRWTPENTTAKYPRLSIGRNSNNERVSSFWIKNADFLRLKHLEVSYSLPNKWLTAAKISQAKIFAVGYNLWTISNLKDRDPELITYDNIPNVQIYSLGIHIQF